MKIATEHQNRALVVSVDGRIDSGNAREFEASMDGVLGKGGRGVILDCGKVTYFGSAGLRVLLKITRELQSRRVHFMVCSLSPLVSEVFRISGFEMIIPVFGSRAEALANVPR